MRTQTQSTHTETLVHSLTQVIQEHLQKYQRDTGTSMGVFVCNVREHYERTHHLHSRHIEWSQVADLSVRMARDAEKFNRWLGDDLVKQLPIDLLESIISAFPSERRFRLQIELASRQGMLAIPMPTGSLSEDANFIGKIAKETGEAIIAISGLLNDGVIDSRDKDKAPAAITEINEAIAVMSAMKAFIERKALGKGPFVVMGVDLLNTHKVHDPAKFG